MTTGKRAAPRHSGPPRPEDPPAPGTGSTGGAFMLFALALGITAAVIAWGYLVYLAIDFGTSARDGDSKGWWLLALSTVGAIACLFVAMMLGARLFARFKATAEPPRPPRPPGGRRAAR